ncbi:hypothetical protein TcasGA2_TC006081 [Tribolium castaneum]|uniref:Uncharacterized protein n=1 Tax=Tribolium castaneum TaxID=7070 RepID=D6WYN2_TRICA|nr:hypothetical protein TcasGA2_TC006081 [Tribolium castaneum]
MNSRRNYRSNFRQTHAYSDHNQLYETQRQLIQDQNEGRVQRPPSNRYRGGSRRGYNEKRMTEIRKTKSQITENDLCEELRKKLFPGTKEESAQDRLESYSTLKAITITVTTRAIGFGAMYAFRAIFSFNNTPVNGNNFDFTVADRHDYVREINKLTEVFQIVRDNLHNSYNKNSRRYNASRRDLSFNVGDRIWRKNKVLSSAGHKFTAKLSPKYVPGTVTEKLSNLVYRIRNEDGSNAGNWHIQDLKQYHVDDSDSSGSETQDEIDENDNNPEHE